MIKENRKKNSQTAFVLYAVIWSLSVPLTGYGMAFAADAVAVPVVQDDLSTLQDPFDIKLRAPALVEFFQKGLEELRRQADQAAKEAAEEAARVAAKKAEKLKLPEKNQPGPVIQPVIVEPVKPKKPVPVLAITGIVYDTDLPQAIINGKVVRAGDTVDGVKVLKIQKGRVDGRFEDENVFLKFNNP